MNDQVSVLDNQTEIHSQTDSDKDRTNCDGMRLLSGWEESLLQEEETTDETSVLQRWDRQGKVR